MEKAKGAVHLGNPGKGPARSHDVTAQIKTLDDLGISRQQSSDWQKLAAIPERSWRQRDRLA